MDEIIQLVERLEATAVDQGDQALLQRLGIITCIRTVQLRHVPVFEPCIVLVLSGCKTILGREPVSCAVGEAVTLPGPGSFDLRNELPESGRPYRALIIPFKPDHLERLRQLHQLEMPSQSVHAKVLHFSLDDRIKASLKHYLESPLDGRMIDHRLFELLLALVDCQPQLMTYRLNHESWSQKARAVISGDLARSWRLAEVCGQLAVSESALRRHLQQESTSFRELLNEQRMSAALSQLLLTSAPVYQIAYDCGYQSVSRFSSNFRERFGVPPTGFRANADESGQHLAESGHC